MMGIHSVWSAARSTTSWFAGDVIVAMLVICILNSLVVFTNIATIPFVFWISRNWVQTNNSSNTFLIWNKGNLTAQKGRTIWVLRDGGGGGRLKDLKKNSSCSTLRQEKNHAWLALHHTPFFHWKNIVFFVSGKNSCTDQICQWEKIPALSKSSNPLTHPPRPAPHFHTWIQSMPGIQWNTWVQIISCSSLSFFFSLVFSLFFLRRYFVLYCRLYSIVFVLYFCLNVSTNNN